MENSELLEVKYENWIEEKVHPVHGYPICAGKAKRVNKYGVKVCLKPPINGRPRCRMHGGVNLAGPAHPNYTTGKYSKYGNVLNGKLLERYEVARANPEILELTEEIALLDSRASELLAGMKEGAASKIWYDLQASGRKLQENRGDAAKVAFYMNEIISLIDRGASVASVWGELGSNFERRRKLVESERKRRESMDNYATAEQQMLLVNTLVALVRDNVKDKTALRAISEGLIRELGSRTR